MALTKREIQKAPRYELESVARELGIRHPQRMYVSELREWILKRLEMSEELRK